MNKRSDEHSIQSYIFIFNDILRIKVIIENQVRGKDVSNFGKLINSVTLTYKLPLEQ